MFRSVLCVMTSITAIVWLSSCNRDPKKVHFVVPDGYKGYVWIILDPREGQAIPEIDGRPTVRIPQNGVLKVKSDRALLGLVQLSAEDYSGRVVKTISSKDSTPDDNRLRPLGVSSDSVHTYIIGTLEDEGTFHRNSGADAQQQLLKRLKDLPDAERR